MSKIYCIYCGSSNDSKNKKCIKCEKYLDAHDFELLKFVGGEVKDDAKGKVIDYVIEFIKSLFTKHIYGTILSLSVIVTLGSTILNVTDNENKNYNGTITSQKYSFNEVGDEVRILGCWHNSGFIYGGDGANTYFKFDNNLTVATGNLFYKDYFLLSYFFYDIPNDNTRYLGSINWDQDDLMGIFKWQDNDTFYLVNQNETYYFTKIDCNDMPDYDQWMQG